MESKKQSASGWGERLMVAFLFTIIGSFLMIVFNPWGKEPVLGRSADYIAKVGTIILLFAAALLARRSSRFVKYSPLLFAFFIMSVVVSLDLVVGTYLVLYLGITGSTPVSAALQKLNEFALVAALIIPFTLVSGGSLGSLYIQKGNLKLGLIIGLVAFTLAAAGSIPMAKLFNAQNLSAARIIPWIPWILVFVLSNAGMEELWFRGLFLRKLDPFFGKFISNFLIAFVFTIMHGTVTYTVNNYFFLAILFPLALAWGYIMQKTDSIWGSILFHAGMDIPILLGIFSGMV